MKLIASTVDPPIAGLLAANYIKSTLTVDVQWAKETSLKVSNDATFDTSVSVSRYLARTSPSHGLYGSSPFEEIEVDHWLSFSIGPLKCRKEFDEALLYLNKVLGMKTFLVGRKLTIADFAVFEALYCNTKWNADSSSTEQTENLNRWFEFIKSSNHVGSLLNTLPEEAKPKEAPAQVSGGRKEEGKFVELPGAEMGKVVVRFPPEASGFLHIGHAKAALLNQYYQEAFKGKLIMRFDDTNPAKEKVDFEKVILEDLEMLQIKPDVYTHTSQYFDLMLELCEKLLKQGKAYVDDTEPEIMKQEREQRAKSKNWNNSAEQNLKLWEEMKKGTELGQRCCVRARIDMDSPNGCMRDPTVYRCKNEPHPRVGTRYKVYPTYDFACPIVDSVEGVTHCLRTTEYHDRDDQFYWFIDALGLRKPYIWEYSRLNMMNTVLSKRKLTWFVEQKLVDGWDDPRFPTVRGVLRRGMTVEGLKQFIVAQGGSRSVVMMEWDKIWAFNKKVIDPVAPRYTAVEKGGRVPVLVGGGVAEEALTVPKHPKNPDVGDKRVWIGPKLLVDAADAASLTVGENVTFINWGNLLIKKINSVDGKIVSVEAVPNLSNKDFKKTLKITWLAETEKAPLVPCYCVYFDNIISKAVLGKDEDFKQFIGHTTRVEVEMLGDPELANVKKSEIIQLQRKGFFICDSEYRPRSVHTSCHSPIILFAVPDGHTKDMPTVGPPKTLATEMSSKEKAQSARGKSAEKSPQDEAPPSISTDAVSINQLIVQQGDKIRKLKGEKAAKNLIDVEVKILQALKSDFKCVTSLDWVPGITLPNSASKPALKPAGSVNSANDLLGKIAEQGDKIRLLKEQKAAKEAITTEVQSLLALKAQFKALTGTDWTPALKMSAAVTVPSTGIEKDALLTKIAEQGDKIRLLKEQKAAKEAITTEVQSLLALKAQFKTLTGTDWTPALKVSAATVSAVTVPSSGNDKDALLTKIAEQGDKIRLLKEQKAAKEAITTEVQSLLALKAQFKALTGTDWTPALKVSAATVSAVTVPNSGNEKDALLTKIAEQGDKIRLLKEQKAAKEAITSEVQSLLALKAQFKALTGTDWTPALKVSAATVSAVNVPSSGNEKDTLLTKIAEQGDKIRLLKEQKAAKEAITTEVQSLLALKAQFKALTGTDWTPALKASAATVSAVTATSTGNARDALLTKIAEQGDKVRQLKADKAAKNITDAEVQVLLSLKKDFKAATGEDWKADLKPSGTTVAHSRSAPINMPADDAADKVAAQGEKVRRLKSEKAAKNVIDAEVKSLLALKADYKALTGADWKPEQPGDKKPAAAVGAFGDVELAEIAKAVENQINVQGAKVRDLKASKASKQVVDEAVAILLEIKSQYKNLTGTDPPGVAAGRTPAPAGPKKAPAKQDAAPKKAPAPTKPEAGAKKQTRLGLEATKEENLPDWYSQVITKGELIEYYDVSGCYILRPWSFAIWESIQSFVDGEIKKLGVENCYFPIFVSKAALEREKTHIADFAPEVAWVTKSGDSDLAEHIAVRPTSETGMYPAYAKWIQSYRDLPIKLNQWNNVVRWEFKHPQPFLRTREFLWQEGHSAFASLKEAEEEVLAILDIYARVYTDLLAIPVVRGRKTEKEKFAGGDFTTTVEAFVSASGRAIQGATSHHLGQNFAKMFDIVYEDPETQEKTFVFQNSWGITTRTIGVMIMVHADNRGLVLPPRVASVQVVITPCGVTASLSAEDREALLSSCKELESGLRAAGVRVRGDYRDNYSPGWKFNHWELKGVPIRVELGPKDLKQKQLVAVRRDTGEKITLNRDEAVKSLAAMLETIHLNMLDKATRELDSHKVVCTDWAQFCRHLEDKKIMLSPFCGDTACEDRIKQDSARDDAEGEAGAPAMGAKSLCIPFQQPAPIGPSDRCIHSACNNKPKQYTLFGRSY